MNNKVITCTGYGSTGSSVVSDLLKEFDNVESKGDYEFRFLFDIHGVRELEVALFQLNNRQNSDYFINAFRDYINYLSKGVAYRYYEQTFNGKFKTISYRFIESIIDVEWSGYWHQNIMNESSIKKFFYYLERFIQKKILREKDTSARFYTNRMIYSRPVSHDDFLKKIQKYMAELFQVMNVDKEYIVLDQLVPPENTYEFLKYFNNNLKIIIVDRDPRDLYLLEKYEYKETWIPFQEVETYVKWYRLIREHKKSEKRNSNVLYINFEDFIYDYDRSIERVIGFIGLEESNWENKRKYFNPDISIKNTKKWLVYPEAKEEIAYIEKHLSEFLSNY